MVSTLTIGSTGCGSVSEFLGVSSSLSGRGVRGYAHE